MDPDYKRYIIVKARKAFTIEQLKEILLTGEPKEAPVYYSVVTKVIVHAHITDEGETTGYDIVVHRSDSPPHGIFATREEVEYTARVLQKRD